MLQANVSPTPRGRKPHHRDHARPRSFIAATVTRERAAVGSLRSGLILDHVATLTGDVKPGRAGAVTRGGNTARAAGAGIGLAIRDHWGVHEGRAVDLLRKMWRLGYLPGLKAPPNEDTAGRALVLLAKITPLVQIVRRGWYRIYACDPASLPAEVAGAIVNLPLDAASPPEATPEADDLQGESAATDEVDCWPWPDDLVSSASPVTPEIAGTLAVDDEMDGCGQRSALRVRGVSRDRSAPASGDFEDPAADHHPIEREHPGGLGCALSGPAEEAQPERTQEAASPAMAPMTFSAWLQAIPAHLRQQQASRLALSPVPDCEGRSASATIRVRLQQRVSTGSTRQVGSREVAAITRGSIALQRAKLLDERHRPPRFIVHPALAAFGLAPQPSAERPTGCQARWCRENGIEPAGLSRREVVALQAEVNTLVRSTKLWRLLRYHGADVSFQEWSGGRLAEGLESATRWVGQRFRQPNRCIEVARDRQRTQ